MAKRVEYERIQLAGDLHQTEECAQRAEEIYGLVCERLVRVSTPEAAELTKLLENIFRSVNIVRAEHERLAPFEALARLAIMRRAALGLSQQQLATRMGTTASAISRIESGQHATNARTLMRLAHALEARAVLGLQYGPPAHPQRELVVI